MSRFLYVILACISLNFFYFSFEAQSQNQSLQIGSLDSIDQSSNSPGLTLHGWALSASQIKNIEVQFNNQPIKSQIALNLPRPDVASALSNPNAANSGWEASISLDLLPLGQHKLTVYAVNAIGERWQLPNQTGTETITIVPGPFRPTPASIASYFVAILFGMFMMSIVKYIRRK